jgi:hypothetical protein
MGKHLTLEQRAPVAEAARVPPWLRNLPQVPRVIVPPVTSPPLPSVKVPAVTVSAELIASKPTADTLVPVSLISSE